MSRRKTMGLFDRFRRPRPQAAGPSARTNLGMVALRSSGQVDLSRIHHQVKAWWPEFPEPGPPDMDGEAGVVRIPGGTVMLGFLPFPIPWGDLEWPCRSAWWRWPDAESALRSHKTHLLVFAASETLSMVDLTLLLTRVLAAAASATECAGIYYGNASVVFEPDDYIAQAKSASTEDLPLTLWLGFHPVREERGLSAYTTGMKTFELLDLEAHDSSLPAGELLGRLADVAAYEISTGIQIKDGETVGSSEKERFQVSHRPSRFGDKGITCQIALGDGQPLSTD